MPLDEVPAKPDHPIRPGAHDLRKHILASGMALPVWCEAKGLDRWEVMRAIDGKTKTPGIDFVADVERVTGIPAIRWAMPGNMRAKLHLRKGSKITRGNRSPGRSRTERA